MNGRPPVYSLTPAASPEAIAFLGMLMSSARLSGTPGYVPESHGWLSAYHCVRCASCGGAVVIGSRCRSCWGPR